MERYEEYKDSGVEWIEEVPAGWEVKKLKYVLSEHSGNGFPDKEQGNKNASIPFYKVSDINGKNICINTSNNYVELETAEKYNWNIVPKHSVITAKIGEALRKNHRKISLVDCIIDNNCIAFEAKTIDYKFNYYLLSAIDFSWFVNPGTVPSLSVEKFKSFIAPIPSIEEQTAIANFLDCKTAEIDELITQKERLLELYKEEKTTIINHAVTKGLNPDAQMRDSGIEGLGEIPAHWEIQQIKQIGILQKGKGGTKADELLEGIPCIRYGDLYTHHRFSIRQSRSYVSPERAFYYTPIQYGDVLFAASGETIDEIGKSAVNLINEDACCGGDVIFLRIKVEASAQFMGYATGSTYAAFQKARMGRGITVMHIYSDQLKHLSVARPPLSEQTAIANFLDLKTAEIDAKVAKIQRIIELQKEYRTTLISEVVTGKMKVSHLAGGETE